MPSVTQTVFIFLHNRHIYLPYFRDFIYFFILTLGFDKYKRFTSTKISGQLCPALQLKTKQFFKLGNIYLYIAEWQSSWSVAVKMVKPVSLWLR